MHSIPTQGCYLARWTGVVYQPSASSWPAIAHLAGKDPSRGSLLLPFPLSIHPGEQVNSVMGALCVRSTGSGQEECIQLTWLLGAYACLADTDTHQKMVLIIKGRVHSVCIGPVTL